MFKHYLATALRHFRQHKLTTSINIVCLTIGLVCFLAIYATISYVSHADRQYPNADRIYMVNHRTGTSITAPTAAFGVAKYLRTDVPELENVARVLASVGVIATEVPISVGDAKAVVSITYADAEFLHVFALPFLAGDSRDALRESRSAVISGSTAQRLYGGVAQALGQSLRLQDGNEVTVRGVVDKLTQPSHMSTDTAASSIVRFDVLLSMDVLEAQAEHDAVKALAIRDWDSPLFATYVVLPRDGSLTADAFRARLAQLGPRHADTETKKHRFGASLVSDYLLNAIGMLTDQETTGISATTMLYFLGALVLFASCVNYANLATAQATTYAKEIGMRRAIGARGGQIMTQFLLEAALMSIAALVLALIFVTVALLVTSIEGAGAVVTSVVTRGSFWLMLATLLIAVTLGAGAYPSFVLARVRPTQAIRAAATKSGGRLAQRTLVAVQFAAAAFMVITVLAMRMQNAEFKRMALSGMDDPFVVLANDMNSARVDYEVLRTELLRQPHIQAVTASALSPWVLIAGSFAVGTESSAAVKPFHTVMSAVNHDFFDTLGIDVLAGRTFDRAYGSDAPSSATGSQAGIDTVVLSRELATEAGWTPDQAIGKTIYHYPDQGAPVPMRVIGVVADRPMSIVSVGPKSNMYRYAPNIASYPLVRISKLDTAAASRELEQVWAKLAPNVALKYHFADQIVAQSFQYFDVVINTFYGVAVLAFCISVLGLIGLSVHVIGRRRQEIGIRKTLGASVQSIVIMLLKDFSIPIFIANVLAWPMAYLLLKVYVSIFTQRTALSVTPFLVGLCVTVLVAWLAVVAQATRAARLSPATVLRHE